ncbi:hypothetical protein [Stratiformator vulcanicus]|nr:hypothetical protein [Stratiformator vulcanicus]
MTNHHSVYGGSTIHQSVPQGIVTHSDHPHVATPSHGHVESHGHFGSSNRAMVRQPIAPPPGTLGRSYFQKTEAIPADEHPRMAILEVKVPSQYVPDPAPGVSTRVTLEDPRGRLPALEEKDIYYDEMRDAWVFETDPLWPGVPQIYRMRIEKVFYKEEQVRRYGRLVAQEVETGSEVVGEKFYRLIPGRRLYVTW